MTEEQYNNATKLEQILYDKTGMLAKNHKDIVEAMEEYAASRDSRQSAVPSECVWKQEDQFDMRCYATSCDAMIAMTEGTPEENDYKYCPFCGKQIKLERGIAG